MVSQSSSASSRTDSVRGQGVISHNTSDSTAPIAIAVCCLFIILALVGGVGIPDGVVLRHLVQTLPLWVGVVFGFRRSKPTGWIGLPLFLFWLVVMSFIWLYLLGIARILSGHFSALEIAMTVVVGATSAVGIVMFWRFKSALSAGAAVSLFVIFAAIQFVRFRVSFLPAIAHR